MKHLLLIEYTDKKLEKALKSTEIGLCNGKMGVSILSFHVYKLTHKDKYKKIAIELIDQIQDSLFYETPLNYKNGLLGIGCGFQYIINNKFVDANSDEVLLEIDNVVKTSIDLRSLNALNLKNGICGIAYYIYLRLINRELNDYSITALKLKEYMIYLIDWIEELIMREKNPNEFNDVYFILCRLYKLDVFNFKVEKLLKICIQNLIDFDYPVFDNYALLGIDSLKLIHPWIFKG